MSKEALKGTGTIRLVEGSSGASQLNFTPDTHPFVATDHLLHDGKLNGEVLPRVEGKITIVEGSSGQIYQNFRRADGEIGDKLL